MQYVGMCDTTRHSVEGQDTRERCKSLMHGFLLMRHAMVYPGRNRLSGRVEVDESYVGGEEKSAHARQTEKKAIVAIGIEIHSPMGSGRVRIRHVSDVSSDSLTEFVHYAVQPGAAVLTDGWKG